MIYIMYQYSLTYIYLYICINMYIYIYMYVCMYAHIKPHSIHLYTCIFAQKCKQRKRSRNLDIYIVLCSICPSCNFYAGFIGLHQFIFLASGCLPTLLEIHQFPPFPFGPGLAVACQRCFLCQLLSFVTENY